MRKKLPEPTKSRLLQFKHIDREVLYACRARVCQYITSSDKTILESVVTLENSENNYQEYFKRLLLRRIYAATDFTEREAEVLQWQWGIMVTPQSVEEIGREFGVTRERIRQIKAKALHKIQYPDQSNRIFL